MATKTPKHKIDVDVLFNLTIEHCRKLTRISFDPTPEGLDAIKTGFRACFTEDGTRPRRSKPKWIKGLTDPKARLEQSLRGTFVGLFLLHWGLRGNGFGSVINTTFDLRFLGERIHNGDKAAGKLWADQADTFVQVFFHLARGKSSVPGAAWSKALTGK